jgi:hypothetical protein
VAAVSIRTSSVTTTAIGAWTRHAPPKWAHRRSDRVAGRCTSHPCSTAPSNRRVDEAIPKQPAASATQAATLGLGPAKEAASWPIAFRGVLLQAEDDHGERQQGDQEP